MEDNAALLYRLDEQDRFVFIGETWLSFALANGGVGLEPDQIMARSLYDFMAGETTCLLYQNILQRVRAGHMICFPFRCDAPTRRQLMEMTIRLDENNLIEFTTRTLWVENRSPMPLFANSALAPTMIVRICGWCKRIELHQQQWVDLEEAVAHLRLFEQEQVPQLSHGICDVCSAMLKKSWVIPLKDFS